MKKPNHNADIKNPNIGTSGVNKTFKKAQENKKNQSKSNSKSKVELTAEDDMDFEAYYAFSGD
ncbi:hypothetical protein [Ichthyenterobacterium magnum]|nr:hypothetical protein [Ichthyenterobacterium magnum]